MSDLQVRDMHPSAMVPIGPDRITKVKPALWPLVTTLASRRLGGAPSLSTAAQEASILLSHIEHRRGIPVRANHRFLTAPPHLARFITESLGMAIAADIGRTYGWHPYRLCLNADALRGRHAPGRLGYLVGESGPRPDLLFWTPAGVVAGEARGRSFPARRPSRTAYATQERRAMDMQRWSDSVAVRSGGAMPPPRWFMAWLWFDDVDNRLDLFDPGEPLLLDDAEAAYLDGVLDEQHDRIALRTRGESLDRATIANRRSSIAFQRVGATAAGDVEWLALVLADEPWSPAEPTTVRSDPNPVQPDQESLDDGADAAVGLRLASVLTTTPAGLVPNIELVARAIEAQLGG